MCGKPYRGFESHPLRKMYFAYILRSLKDGTYYYGSSQDISNRVEAHNAGKVRYTKGHRPYELQYREEYSTRGEAVHREMFFKSIAGYRWLKERGIILVRRITALGSPSRVRWTLEGSLRENPTLSAKLRPTKKRWDYVWQGHHGSEFGVRIPS